MFWILNPKTIFNQSFHDLTLVFDFEALKHNVKIVY